MFFNFFKEEEKFVRRNYYACKHCKFSCDDCKTVFCYSCDVHEGNPCPKCGKNNKQARLDKESKD